MKNQYVGDIGDYTKLGLLRAVERAGLSVGVNWYLTPDDGKPDGKFTQYLFTDSTPPDEELCQTLRRIVTFGSRSVRELENSCLLKTACYFSESLCYVETSNRPQRRAEWHERALEVLWGRDVVFLNPDNGLETKSRGLYCANGNKYVAYREADDYYDLGASVIVYQHRDHTPEAAYLERLTRFQRRDATATAKLICVRASRQSVRDYLILAQVGHREVLGKAMENLVLGEWRRFFSIREL